MACEDSSEFPAHVASPYVDKSLLTNLCKTGVAVAFSMVQKYGSRFGGKKNQRAYISILLEWTNGASRKTGDGSPVKSLNHEYEQARGLCQRRGDLSPGLRGEQ